MARKDLLREVTEFLSQKQIKSRKSIHVFP